MSKIFKKYPSIENHYRDKHISKWLGIFPELADCDYVIQEKLHGTNMQLIFNSEQSDGYVIASRNRCVPMDESFFGVRDVLSQEKYNKVFDYFKNKAKELGEIVRVYGELAGSGIQKGVDYGEKSFRIFDVSVGDFFVSPERLKILYEHFSEIGANGEAECFSNYGVVVNSLEKALEYDCNIETKFGSGICEGVVIKPITHNAIFNKFSHENMSRVFYLKKKNESFLEVSKNKKEHKPQSVELFRHYQLFKTYITENRLQNIFSKEGIIETDKDIGKYIKFMIQDAKQDFLKDNEGEYDEKVFNAGKDIVQLLRRYL